MSRQYDDDNPIALIIESLTICEDDAFVPRMNAFAPVEASAGEPSEAALADARHDVVMPLDAGRLNGSEHVIRGSFQNVGFRAFNVDLEHEDRSAFGSCPGIIKCNGGT